MKRDMSLIRAILLLIDKGNDNVFNKIEVPNYTQRQIDYHLYLMDDAGMIGGTERPLYLTWEGHNFLDAARDDEKWERVKEVIQKVGGAPFQIWLTLLAEK
jgi:hypothetical protein